MMISVVDRVENIAEKGENACYQHFLLKFPQCFQKDFFLWVVKSRDCVVKSLKEENEKKNLLNNIIKAIYG